MEFQQFFNEQHVCQGAWKTIRNTFKGPFVLQSRGQGPQIHKRKGTTLSHTFKIKLIFFPVLEIDESFKCIYDSFPSILTYFLFLNFLWNCT